MNLITRRQKGTFLTPDELDNNLLFIESLGVTDIIKQDNKLTFKRVDENEDIEVLIDNNLPVVSKKDLGKGNIIYQGVMEYSFEEPTNTIPLVFNPASTKESFIDAEWGKNYFIDVDLINCLDDICSTTKFQYPLYSNPNYNPNASFLGSANNILRNIQIQSDGKIIIGGWFGFVSGLNANYLARLNPDGTRDTSFMGGFDSTTRAIKILTDGKILVGGQITQYYEDPFTSSWQQTGINIGYLAKLNSDGTLDSTFDIGQGFNDSVSALHVYTDGKFLAAGDFTDFNGTTANRIIRLNSDGTIDPSFNSGTGFNGRVNDVFVQSDGKILVGGWFTEYNGESSNRIIRLNPDGSRDTTFNIGTGFNNRTVVIKVDGNGKILVGGQYGSFNGVSAGNLIRLNPDGSRDTSFDIGTGFNSGANIVKIQPDGKILVGGQFVSFNGDSSVRYIVRLNSDGSLDEKFDKSIGFEINNWVRKIQLQGDKILVGSWSGLTRLNSDGTSDLVDPSKSKFSFGGGSPTVGGFSLTENDNENLSISINTSTNRGFLKYKLIETLV